MAFFTAAALAATGLGYLTNQKREQVPRKTQGARGGFQKNVGTLMDGSQFQITDLYDGNPVVGPSLSITQFPASVSYADKPFVSQPTDGYPYRAFCAEPPTVSRRVKGELRPNMLCKRP